VKKLFISLLIGLSHHAAIAQEYYVKQYRVDKGLPSDIIKACAQDSLGYFWSATDEGLVKYDGVKFTTYRKAMHSNYAKGFLTTRSGKLIAFGDLDVIEIQNLGDTVIFTSLNPVSRFANDSSLSYPKLLYEDFHGNIWVSESQSVVRLKKNSIQRYPFDLANRSPQFLRSFAFFEDRNHNLYTTSFQGNVFRYNTTTDTFELIPEKLPSGIEFASVIDNQLIVGAQDGLFVSTLPLAGGFEEPQQILQAHIVSHVAKLNHNNYFVATRGNVQFIGNLQEKKFTPIDVPITSVNHTFFSREDDIWISSNEGIFMLHENLFQRVGEEKITDFIESITEDPITGIIYYATFRTLFAFDPATKKNRVLLDRPSGYFQVVAHTPQGIWAANAFKVFLFNNGKIIREFDFTHNGRFVTDLVVDRSENVWIAIPGINHVYKITPQLELEQVNVLQEDEGIINLVREGHDGMYLTSPGEKSYLFFKATDDSVFRNISLPLNFPLQSDFNITDLVTVGNKIWLASTEGLLKYDHHTVNRVYLGDTFTTQPVKSTALHPLKKLLISNASGLVLYDLTTDTYDLYNESSGFLSNTITPHGIYISQDTTIWIGTAKGLCFSENLFTRMRQTLHPKFIQTLVNGKPISLQVKRSEIPFGSFLEIQVSSITFPENEVIFQYRMNPQDNWVTSAGRSFQFSDLPAGLHTLEVRAKKNGAFSWSDSTQLTFSISKPYWQQWWFYVLAIIGLMTVVGSTTAGVNARNKKRELQLQQLIDERTQELTQRNQELVSLNQEKNNLIGIVAHDLKSPLNQIVGLLSLLKSESPLPGSSGTYLDLAQTSATRLNQMIMKILDVDAIESKSINLKLERVNVAEVMNNIANRYQAEAQKKRITIHRNIDMQGIAHADKNYLEQAIENLLSNAIKFSPFDRNIFLSVFANGKIVFEVKDEGPGLSHEDQQKLFGKYQRLSARPTGNEVSTGLGLSIVKKFVTAMDGEIWCESEVGKGTSFFVALKPSSH